MYTTNSGAIPFAGEDIDFFESLGDDVQEHQTSAESGTAGIPRYGWCGRGL